jgi:hypothetical protein
MHLVFGLDFDAGFWPGPLGDRAASAGEDWVGPFGLLDVLETALGLRGPPVFQSMRVAALVPAVRNVAGFWSTSAGVDPFATARALLRLRDELALHGWRGEHASPRLAELAGVTEGVRPGYPDRLRAVEEALALRRAELESIDLADPEDSLPRCWKSVFSSLRAQGTRIASHRAADRETARDPATDLARACAPGFRPRRDGTLQLFRPPGPLQAAEAVAAFLASGMESGPRDPTLLPLLIGPDAVLDAALRRFGLPATGASRRATDNLLLQILPLVIEMAWSPSDPQRALELLTLPVSPVPPSLAWRLRRALEEWPAVDSDEWRAAVRQGLESIPDPIERKRRAERITGIFDARLPAGAVSYPAEEVRRRISLVRSWLMARASRMESGPVADLAFQAALAQCAALEEVIALAGLEDFPRPLLARLIGEATSLCGEVPGIEAGAGLASIGSPGGLVGSAPVVVWWRFTRSNAAWHASVPVPPEERVRLSQVGVHLPQPGEAASVRARLWRRPFEFASTLLLVSPLLDEQGEEESPHPFWDEVLGYLQDRGSADLLRYDEPRCEPAPRRHRPALLAIPRARVEWTAPADVPLRERATESPTSLESLLGCSFRYEIAEVARVKSGGGAVLDHPSSSLLLGKLVHRVLERALAGSESDPERVAAEAERLFGEEGPRLAAALFLPGRDALRAGIRAIISHAAKDLARRFPDGELRGAWIEADFEGQISGRRLRARPDLVLPGRRPVLDLKTGSSRYLRQSLRKGTSIQLAVYSLLAATNGRPAAVGLYLAREGRILSPDAGAFPEADVIAGPGMAEVWQGLERAAQERWAEIGQGRLVAPGAGEEEDLPEEGLNDDGLLVLRPPCTFCDLDGLCGHRRRRE